MPVSLKGCARLIAKRAGLRLADKTYKRKRSKRKRRRGRRK